MCCGAGSKENLGMGMKRGEHMCDHMEKKETGRRSKDLNIICDTTTLQDRARYKTG